MFCREFAFIFGLWLKTGILEKYKNFVKTIIVPRDKKDIGHRADKYDRASPPSPYKNRYLKVTNSS